MFNIGLYHYLILSTLLFGIGLYGVLVKRHAIAVLLCIELMLNAVNINLIAFSRFLFNATAVGQLFAIFVIVVAACEIAIGLAICIALYRGKQTIELENFNLLRW
jgi:NADH:ubiquinone oxidoreductase subunit K